VKYLAFLGGDLASMGEENSEKKGIKLLFLRNS
jgi:hypothetical protein